MNKPFNIYKHVRESQVTDDKLCKGREQLREILFAND